MGTKITEFSIINKKIESFISANSIRNNTYILF